MSDEIEGQEVGRITIREVLTEDNVLVYVERDGTADDSLVTALGLLEFAKDSTIRESMEGDDDEVD